MDSTSSDSPAASPRKRGIEHALILAGSLLPLALLVALGLFIEPDPRGFGTHEKLGLPACKPMELWNVPCPGCGVTTSMALAAHGHVWASIVNQPFGFACALLAPLIALWGLAHHVRGLDLNEALQKLRFGRLGLVFGLLMALSWAYKLARVRGWLS